MTHCRSLVLAAIAVLAISTFGVHHAGAADLDAAEVPELPDTGVESEPRQIELGKKIPLTELGPTIGVVAASVSGCFFGSAVNEDGTLRKISNWESLTPEEQNTASKRLSERNAERMELLRKAEAARGKDEQLAAILEAMNKGSDGSPSFAAPLMAMLAQEAAQSAAKLEGGGKTIDVTKLDEILSQLEELKGKTLGKRKKLEQAVVHEEL